MTLGIFNKMFPRPTLGESLDAVAGYGLRHIQFNLSSAALESMPSTLSAAQCASIRGELDARQITNQILSATFNIIHPDPERRETGFARFALLAHSAKSLGTHTLSVSTGTRDPGDMWHEHPDNDSEAAWLDMLRGMARLAAIAGEQDVSIAFEPEQANVVNSAKKARAAIDALESARVKVLIDAANLLNRSNVREQDRVLKEAFDLLGDRIVVAHAKEFSAEGQLGGVALGRGVVDFPLYVALLRGRCPRVPLIMHGFPEAAVAESLAHLGRILQSAASASR